MNSKIKILSVGRSRGSHQISVFRKEQGESLKEFAPVEYFNIEKGGISGYIKSWIALKKRIKEHKYDLIHAHYGLSGMASVLQRKIPVVITFHGSDIWKPSIRMISLVASHLSAWNIFISKKLREHAKGFRKKRSSIIPCGIDLNTFFPIDKDEAKRIMNLNENDQYILFSGSFNNKIKNYLLAKKVVHRLKKVKLIELKDFSKAQVNNLMNACDGLLVTSFYESGPLVVKEAMACNLPIVSTDVGDVKSVIESTKSCYLVNYDSQEIVDKLKLILDNPERANGRDKIHSYDLKIIAERIFEVFEKIILKKRNDISFNNKD